MTNEEYTRDDSEQVFFVTMNKIQKQQCRLIHAIILSKY